MSRLRSHRCATNGSYVPTSGASPLGLGLQGLISGLPVSSFDLEDVLRLDGYAHGKKTAHNDEGSVIPHYLMILVSGHILHRCERSGKHVSDMMVRSTPELEQS